MPKPAQAYEPEVPVEVREWISSALASPDLVNIDLEPDELRCDLGKAFAAPRQQISVAAYSGDDRALFRPFQVD